MAPYEFGQASPSFPLGVVDMSRLARFVAGIWQVYGNLISYSIIQAVEHVCKEKASRTVCERGKTCSCISWTGREKDPPHLHKASHADLLQGWQPRLRIQGSWLQHGSIQGRLLKTWRIEAQGCFLQSRNHHVRSLLDHEEWTARRHGRNRAESPRPLI